MRSWVRRPPGVRGGVPRRWGTCGSGGGGLDAGASSKEPCEPEARGGGPGKVLGGPGLWPAGLRPVRGEKATGEAAPDTPALKPGRSGCRGGVPGVPGAPAPRPGDSDSSPGGWPRCPGLPAGDPAAAGGGGMKCSRSPSAPRACGERAPGCRGVSKGESDEDTEPPGAWWKGPKPAGAAGVGVGVIAGDGEPADGSSGLSPAGAEKPASCWMWKEDDDGVSSCDGLLAGEAAPSAAGSSECRREARCRGVWPGGGGGGGRKTAAGRRGWCVSAMATDVVAAAACNGAWISGVQITGAGAGAGPAAAAAWARWAQCAISRSCCTICWMISFSW